MIDYEQSMMTIVFRERREERFQQTTHRPIVKQGGQGLKQRTSLASRSFNKLHHIFNRRKQTLLDYRDRDNSLFEQIRCVSFSTEQYTHPRRSRPLKTLIESV